MIILARFFLNFPIVVVLSTYFKYKLSFKHIFICDKITQFTHSNIFFNKLFKLVIMAYMNLIFFYFVFKSVNSLIKFQSPIKIKS